jgi:hypothetical protein
MIAMAKPILAWTWSHEDHHSRIECLRCGWSVSILEPLPLRDLDDLIAQVKAEHRNCETPPPSTTGT